MDKRRFKTAFILGAGLGTRLRPLTEDCPKPLLEAGGRPVVTYAMDRLIEAGVERFIVNTHHRPEVYGEKFPDRRWRGREIVFRHEPELLDTAGGLKNVEDLLDGDEAVICHNGDVYADFPLAGLVASHERHRPEATLALRSRGPLLNVSVTGGDDGDGGCEVCDLRGALGTPGARDCLFTGIYAMETSLLRRIEAGKPESIVTIFLQSIAGRRGSIRGKVVDDGVWLDIGTIDAYEGLARSLRAQARRRTPTREAE
ncbi:MAG: nucleotidyltransferase family protein [Acidobacteriota bacterium]|jgi:NDP-sugar pyrophosphorylase family protein|nr:nucleotidyltransferase family protein [Acidobacteriota bacterium]